MVVGEDRKGELVEGGRGPGDSPWSRVADRVSRGDIQFCCFSRPPPAPQHKVLTGALVREQQVRGEASPTMPRVVVGGTLMGEVFPGQLQPMRMYAEGVLGKEVELNP